MPKPIAIMNCYHLLLTLILPAYSLAFFVETALITRVGKLCSIASDDQALTGKLTYSSLVSTAKEPDMERAKECAEHFGKCSISELKDLRAGLHQKLIHDAVFGDIRSVTSTTAEDILQERFLEQELSLQLSLLHDEMPPSYLFSDLPAFLEETDDEGNAALVSDEMIAAKVRKEGQNQALEELVEEGVLDSLAICALIGILMLAPQLVLQ